MVARLLSIRALSFKRLSTFEKLGSRLLAFRCSLLPPPRIRGSLAGPIEFCTYPLSYIYTSQCPPSLFLCPNIPAQSQAHIGICVSFLLLQKKLPQKTQWLKQHIFISHSFPGSGVRFCWVLCSGSNKTVIKVLTGAALIRGLDSSSKFMRLLAEFSSLWL